MKNNNSKSLVEIMESPYRGVPQRLDAWFFLSSCFQEFSDWLNQKDVDRDAR